MWESVSVEDAEYLLVGFGLSARICKSAVSVLRKAGVKAGLFRPITLWPFPIRAARRGRRGKEEVAGRGDERGTDGAGRAARRGRRAPVDFLGTLGGITPQVDAIVERITGHAG